MPGQGRLYRDLGSFEIANFTDHDDTGVLPEQRAERPGERIADIGVNLDLVHPADVVFDRVRDSDDFLGAVADRLQRRVERCRTAPCKTWAGSISKTVAGGEIDNLDEGGFGALTITKSITIDGGGANIASTLVSATAGMNINAASNDVVILRNLQFDGLLGNGTGTAGTPGTQGINVIAAGRVVIENCHIFGFASTGIFIGPAGGTVNVKIQNTTVNNNGGGIDVKPTSGTVNVQIERTHSDENVGGGIRIDGTAGGTVNASITDTSASLNGTNALNALSGTSNVTVDVERAVFGQNGGIGVNATNANGGTATVTVGSSILSNNATAWGIAGTASLQSYKNNQVTGAPGASPATATFQ